MSKVSHKFLREAFTGLLFQLDWVHTFGQNAAGRTSSQLWIVHRLVDKAKRTLLVPESLPAFFSATALWALTRPLITRSWDWYDLRRREPNSLRSIPFSNRFIPLRYACSKNSLVNSWTCVSRNHWTFLPFVIPVLFNVPKVGFAE